MNQLLPMYWLFLFACIFAQKQPYEYVDTIIGANCDWYYHPGDVYPGAALPFGMVQLSPDTSDGGDNGAGYSTEHKSIKGFSFTHMSGVGCLGDFGNLQTMPSTGEFKYVAGRLDESYPGWRSRYTKSTEVTSAGYYSVVLSDYNIKTEATTTQRAGILRFTFPQNDVSRIQIDFSHRIAGASDFQHIEVVNDHAIRGWMLCTSQCGGWCYGHVNYTVYFYAEFSRPFEKYGFLHCDIPSGTDRKGDAPFSSKYMKFVVENSNLLPSSESTEGTHNGFYTEFPTKPDEQVTVAAGISYVDMQGAENNFREEISGKSFDEVLAAARMTWNSVLSMATVTSTNENRKTIFYTALYHAFLDPRVFSDRDGRYFGGKGFIGNVNNAPYPYTRRTIFSGWDVFRSEFPLLTLLSPETSSDQINTLMALADEWGNSYMERWELAAGNTGCMIGAPINSVIADAVAKGILDFNVSHALELMIGSSNHEANINGQEFRSNPVISETLEYSYFDWCISRVANYLQERDIEDKYIGQSKWYKNIWDPSHDWFRVRKNNGDWDTWPANGVLEGEYGSIECNPLQQGWFVPHDVGGFVELLGGKDAAIRRLEDFFEKTPNLEWNDYYNHANEPVHLAPFLFNKFGAPWLTQRWVRWIQLKGYDVGSDGLVGNEDVGQMSAWYALTAMGLHPASPGDSTYEIMAPLFDQVVLALPNGKNFTITTQGNSDDNFYIQSTTLNGAAYRACRIEHSEILKGGELVIVLGREPNEQWGV